MQPFKLIFVAALLTLAALFSISCDSGDDETSLDKAPEGPGDSLVVELAGVDSTSVFDLLKTSHEIEYRSTVTGTFVTSIDSVVVADGYFWVYSVNDSMATVACDKYVTAEGDRVKWHYRSMAR